MPEYTYHYFDGKILGEGPRLLLAYGDQKFEDVRHTLENFSAFKSKTPFGCLPVLYIDDKLYTQSVAISRYLGKKFGVYGDTDEEALEIDQNVDFVYDIRAKASAVYYESDPAIKEKKHEENSKNVYPDLFAKLSEIIEKNNGHLAAGKLSWSDFLLAGMMDYFKLMTRIPDLTEKYPALQKIHTKVYFLPQVKAYVESRPPFNQFNF